MEGFSILIVGGGALLTLLMIYAAVAGPSATKATSRRLESVRERHSKSTEVAAQAQLKRILAGRQATRVDSLVQQFMPNPALLRLRLEQTGRNWTLGQYGIASAGLAIVAMLLLWLRGAPLLLALFAGLAIGIGLPHFIVGRFIKKRIADFTAKFPDAIELMVRGLRSGLPISETIAVVGAEIPGPVGIEFQNVADKMRIGRTMEAALQEAANRLGTPEMQFFCITLAIQRETGGNLAETLGNLADVLRKRAAMRLKIRAMSSESKASAWIVGSLPFVVFAMVWFVNPAYLAPFFTDQRLIIAGLGGMLWMSMGAFIMAKMISFEI